MSELYPMKFRPILKEKIWGGNKLQTMFGRKAERTALLGESWDISAVEGSLSELSNGFLAGNSIQELIEIYMGDLLGDKVYEQFGDEFPLLIKFIDASDDLSIQVHPNNALAKKRHQAYGKTEMWYVLQADKGASLISGFAEDCNKGLYKKHLAAGTVDLLVNDIEVSKGDVLFVPPGRIHAIRKGVLLAEIQQTSDITYRIYDWMRTDHNGESRELHTKLAIDAIDYSKTSNAKEKKADTTRNVTTELASCEYFTTSKLEFDAAIEKDYNNIDSFVIYMNVGTAKVDIVANGNYTTLNKGETVLIPAEIKNLALIPTGKSELLEVYIK